MNEVKAIPAKENPNEKSLPALGQGRYQCKKFLGEGAVGQVWLAYDTQLERSVALKLLHQDNTDQVAGLKGLKDEVQKSLELTHPNIIRAYDLVEPPEEAAFITMEFVEGEVLSDKLKQQPEGRFVWPDLEPYILNLCDALEYAHERGMVHRDLKPANVIVSAQEDELKLADFGISATTKISPDDTTIEVARAGTPIYWSPQQATGLPPEPTDDIYSLGVMLYQMLVGEPPFVGGSEPEITQQHWTKSPVDPQQALEQKGAKTPLPGYLSELILKCLAKDPINRPQRVGEVRDWIKAKGDPAIRRQKRMAMVATASVALMVVMGALTVWAVTQKQEAVKQKGIA